MLRWILAVGCLLSAACFRPNLSQADMSISDDIQNEAPNALTFAIFGQGTAEGIDEDDNLITVSTLYLLASEDTNLCDTIGNNPVTFFADLTTADIGGEFVSFTFQGSNPVDGPQEFSNNINANFLVSNGTEFVVDAINSDQTGSFRLLDFEPGERLSANFSVRFDFDRNNFINSELDATLDGRFLNASPCAAIDEFFSIPLVFEN